MKLLKLQLINFLSYKNEVIDFSNGKKFVIIGKNGSGKSTILEAIYWTLFGKARISNNKLINYDNINTYCRCILIFKHSKNVYKIVRTFKDKKHELDISINKVQVDRQTMLEKQVIINTIFKTNNNLFLYTNYLRQGELNQFTSLQLGQQKDLLLSVFDFNVFSKCYNRVKVNYDKMSIKKYHYEEMLELAKDKIAKDKLREDVENSKIEFEIVHKQLVSAYKEVTLFNEKNNLSEKIEHNKKRQDKLQSIKYLNNELDTDQRDLNRRSDEIEKSKNKCEYITKKCPFLVGTVKEIDRLTERIMIIKKEIIDEQSKYQNIKEFDIAKLVDIKKDLDKKYYKLKSDCSILENKIKIIKDNGNKESTDLDILKKHLFELTHNFNNLKNLMFIFSKKGFMLYLIYRYVSYLNVHLSTITPRLGLQDYKVEFNTAEEGDLNSFKLTITKDRTVELDYNNLSGGEKVKIDLLIRFAFIELMNNLYGTNINILLIDEISELDENNVQIVMNFLELYKEKYNQIFLVTHLEGFKDYFNTNEIIEVEKNNDNYSKVK